MFVCLFVGECRTGRCGERKRHRSWLLCGIKTIAIHTEGEVDFTPPKVDRESLHLPVRGVMLAAESGHPAEFRTSAIAEYPDSECPHDRLAVQRIRPKMHNKPSHPTPTRRVVGRFLASILVLGLHGLRASIRGGWTRRSVNKPADSSCASPHPTRRCGRSSAGRIADRFPSSACAMTQMPRCNKTTEQGG